MCIGKKLFLLIKKPTKELYKPDNRYQRKCPYQ